MGACDHPLREGFARSVGGIAASLCLEVVEIEVDGVASLTHDVGSARRSQSINRHVVRCDQVVIPGSVADIAITSPGARCEALAERLEDLWLLAQGEGMTFCCVSREPTSVFEVGEDDEHALFREDGGIRQCAQGCIVRQPFRPFAPILWTTFPGIEHVSVPTLKPEQLDEPHFFI